jgi:hypothetical protein
VRSEALAVISCLLAAACSQLLGIDGRYSRDESSPVPSAGPGVLDAGAAGSAEQPAMNMGGAGGSAMETQMQLVLPPAVPGKPPHVEPDAGRSPCMPGYKVCGEVCTEIAPEHGCGGLRCEPCLAHANAHTSCGKDGACESICNAGFMPAGADCVPQTASGGAPGAGGAPPSKVDAGSTGGASSTPETCDPLECPTCNRGFEGCCIPAAPDGTPSRCGCFYFPPLCTIKVPG